MSNCLKKPIFILGAHKSGTSLIRSLLDGHPELFVLPVEAHFFQYSGFWVDYSFRKAFPQMLSYEEIKQRYIQWLRYLNSSQNPFADGITKGKWNILSFEKYLNDNKCTSMPQLISVYVKAIYYSLYSKEINPMLRIVEKSVENAEFAFELKTYFPDSKFIHIVRNPYATIVAIRKFRSVGSLFPRLKNALLSLYNSYYYLYKNMMLLNNYKVIKYEDLVTEPEHVMKRVAEFLEINYYEGLCRPTLLGSQWLGNSTSGEKFRGISTSTLSRWKDDITELEIVMVNRFFPFVIRDFGYVMLNNKSSPYFPVKGENFKTYLHNRLFLRLFSGKRLSNC